MLTQVLLDADIEKQELADRVAHLEMDLARALEGSSSNDVDLQRQLSNAEHGLAAWSEYSAMMEEENERLVHSLQELQEAEAQRIAAKGGDTPRENNPGMNRPSRPGEGENADEILKELHAKNVAKERAQAKVDELAK